MNTECKIWLRKKLADIGTLESYAPEKTIEGIAKQFGLSPTKILKLNFNENLFIPRQKIVDLLKQTSEECDLRLYPQEEEERLRDAIADYLRLEQGCIAIGNSSDEVMDRITRLFLEKGESAVTFSPTFSVFKLCVKYQGAQFISVPLKKGFQVDVEAMLASFRSETKLLYLCSPNNPTGNQLGLEEMEALIEEFPGIVIVDEAYGEFADYSIVPLIEKYENLIVLRTFSKAFGLAGLRLGYAVSSHSLSNAVNKIPAPYAINTIALTMGRKLLENIEIMKEAVSDLKIERAKLIRSMNEIGGVEAFDSQANFVLFNLSKPYENAYVHMLEKGLIIKKLGRLLEYENCLRTTVGLPQMNAKLLNALTEYLSDQL